MDWLSFIAKIVGALAWPAVVVLLLFFVRPHLSALARRLESLKLPLPNGMEALLSFREEVQTTLTTVDVLVPPPAVLASAIPPSAKELAEDVSQADPTKTIMESWELLDSEVQNQISKKLPPESLFWTQPYRMDAALERLGLANDEVAAVMELRNLRNRIAHAGASAVTSHDAIRFKAATTRLLARIMQASERA